MKKLILFLILNCLAFEYIIGQNSFLQRQGTATQLVVHGMPFLILGEELGLLKENKKAIHLLLVRKILNVFSRNLKEWG